MANIFEKPTKFAGTALELLRRTIKAPGLFIHKYTRADFAGAHGDTINVKRPAILRARDKGFRTNNAIVIDDLMQTSIPVKLTAFPYSAVALTIEEETLDDVDYVRDVQAPQVRAVADFYEELIVSGLAGAKYSAGRTITYDVGSADPKRSDARKVASRARRLFTEANVPDSGGFWLVGSVVAEAIRDTDKLLEVDASGLPEALREGVVTRLSGFTVVELGALAPEESYFTHETALAVANVGPVVPKGAIAGASITAPGGLAVTQVWDYDAINAKDRSIVMSFAGVAPVTDPKIGTNKEDAATYGKILTDGEGAPVLEFVRAVKVLFAEPAPVKPGA